MSRLRRTAVYSTPSVGKTLIAAMLAIWFWATHYPSKVITTAPSNRQVEHQLWAHINALHQQSRLPLGGICLAKMLRNPDNPDHFALGFSTKPQESESVTAQLAQGWHSPNLLVILDEANGVPHHIVTTLNRMLMTGASSRMLMIGNTVSPAGYFYDVRRGQGPSNNCITITAFDTPNVQAGEELIPGLVTQQWVEDIRKEAGEDSLIYRSLVLAEFPEDDPQGLIPLSWVEAAEQRWADIQSQPGEVVVEGTEIVGCDPGKSETGDARAIVRRRGNVVLDLELAHGLSTMETAGRLKAEADAGAIVCLDVIGIGTGIYDRLEEQDVDVVGVNFAEHSDAKDSTGLYGMLNKRAQYWWAMREALDPNGAIRLAIPPNNKLRYDLTAPRWWPTSAGKIQIEKKEDIRKRLGRSPDLGDALACTFAAPYDQDIVCFTVQPPGLMTGIEERLKASPIGDPESGSIFSRGGFGTMARVARDRHRASQPTKTEEEEENADSD